MAAHLKTMSLQDVQLVLGRALMDSGFRGKLTKNPGSTLKALGYDADRKLVSFFGGLSSASFDSAAKAVGKDYHEQAADGISRPRLG